MRMYFEIEIEKMKRKSIKIKSANENNSNVKDYGISIHPLRKDTTCGILCIKKVTQKELFHALVIFVPDRFYFLFK